MQDLLPASNPGPALMSVVRRKTPAAVGALKPNGKPPRPLQRIKKSNGMNFGTTS